MNSSKKDQTRKDQHNKRRRRAKLKKLFKKYFYPEYFWGYSECIWRRVARLDATKYDLFVSELKLLNTNTLKEGVGMLGSNIGIPVAHQVNSAIQTILVERDLLK